VIQRFGDIKKLVEQTLDPMVSAYFKNIGQTRTLIQLLQDRSSIQQQASVEMKDKFEHYNLELEEVLIGTPTSPEDDTQIEAILTQLRSRQIATEQVETYDRQEQAAVKERELRQAEARAQMQTKTDRGGVEHQHPNRPGQGRISAFAPAGIPDQSPGSSRGREGSPRRYCPSISDRGTGASLWRATVPGHADRAQPLLRGHPVLRRGCRPTCSRERRRWQRWQCQRQCDGRVY